ncbi:MAG: formate dehydrogenase, partial [Gammaproteobacteria bacterium]|nr:formate dehydrogenase [Gammaproteobacteria bacterium]
RPGAWNLDPQSAEGKRGFLLNHLISELLPEKGDGYRYSNSDPLTGQAAWFDLRVKVEKAAIEEAVVEPRFQPTARPPKLAPAPAILRYGESFRKSREKGRPT